MKNEIRASAGNPRTVTPLQNAHYSVTVLDAQVRPEIKRYHVEVVSLSLITKSVPPICTKSVPLYIVNFPGSKPGATCTEWTYTSP